MGQKQEGIKGQTIFKFIRDNSRFFNAFPIFLSPPPPFFVPDTLANFVTNTRIDLEGEEIISTRY